MTTDEDGREPRCFADAEHRGELGGRGTEGAFEGREERWDPPQRHVGNGLGPGQLRQCPAIDPGFRIGGVGDVGGVSHHRVSRASADRTR